MDLSQGNRYAVHRVLSRPAEVWWAGFRSDTYRLQQAGWEIAVEEDVRGNRMRLLMKHRDMRLHALSHHTGYDYHGAMYYQARLPVFEVVHVVSNFETVRLPDSFAHFRQIDAEPQYVQQEIKSIDDLKIFAAPMVRTEELIVEPANVAAMLERIREMQVPEQERLRQKERLRQAREAMEGPRQHFHAQIISIEEYRKAA